MATVLRPALYLTRLRVHRALFSVAPNPMFCLEGKTALVTGGARDIGGACAIELARAGADVCINYNASEKDAEETCNIIRSFGRKAYSVQANAFEQEGIDTVVSGATSFFDGSIDILVNNAGGLNKRGELCDDTMTAELIFENMNMNFVSTALMCKAVIPHMQRAGFGRIINMGSIAGNNGGSGTTTPHYGPAKAAVACLGRSLAQTYAKDNININTIAPGVIDNGFHAVHTTPENMEMMRARIPQGRFGTNQEVGAVAAFLASPAAGHVNGQVIHVNGGMLFGS